MRYFSITSLAAFAALLGACTQPASDTSNEAANASDNATSLPELPIPALAMGRAELLAAVTQAASAAAGGVDDGDAQMKLDGKPFEVRLRFGCGGPAEVAAGTAMSWRFDPAKRTLRLRAAPDISIDQPLPAAIAGDRFEAAEGFWIARPWLLQPGCPAVPQPADSAREKPAAAVSTAEKASGEPSAVTEPVSDTAEHRIGIAQFFSDTDSRTSRRDGRPYEATKSLAEGQAPSAQGYDLVLSGRLKRLPDGRVIACRVEQPDRPPQCIASVDFDRVWIERPDTQESIAEWSAGG